MEDLNVVDSINGAGSWLVDAGRNIIQGLINGWWLTRRCC